jgi:hypothetical protein
MEYKEITLLHDGSKHIIIENNDGSFKSFPVDETNPEYLAFFGIPEAPEVTQPEEE